MPNTVRADARTLPEATRHPNADAQALAAEFEAARAYDRSRRGHRTDEESYAATDRQHEIAEKVAALPSTDMSTMRLKARVYMWAEGADDLERFDNGQHDAVSGPVLVSLFRDLLAANEQSMTAEQWAAMDFEPWTHSEDEWKPPTDKEFADDTRLPAVRLAWHIVHKTKAELVAGAVKMGAEDGVRLIDGIAEAREFFERCVGVLQSAEVRLICAGTAVELKEGR
jgi:hypothetical protein